MYGQQASIDPALAALMQTAQMVTPDQTPTVAAQVAQAAQQKMQPQGIAQGMPQIQGMQGATQDYAAAAPSVARNAQEAQMRQALQLATQPKPAGIEGLQSNVRMAEGGVVGFAGTDEFGSFVPNPEAIAIDELRVAEAKRRREDEERRRQLEFLEQSEVGGAAGETAATLRRQLAPPPVAKPATQPATQPAAQPQPSPQPRPQPKSQAVPQAAPTGVAAALAQRPTYDTTGIAAAATPYIQAGEGDVGRIRKAEEKRAEVEKTLPDLSAKGIAALQQRMQDVETAEATRKEKLGLDRVIQQLLGRAQGSGGAARADIQFMNAQRAAEDAVSQARLGNQQAQLLLEKAQQERQLGREDRAIALEKEAANRMEKARDDALKAQQIAQSGEAAKYQGAVQMRGHDIQAQTAMADRMQQAQLEGAKLKQQAEQNNQMKLANLINSANITVNNAVEKAEKMLERKYGAMMKMMTPEVMQKNPQMAASYENYLKDKDDIYKQTVEPAVMERGRLAAQIGGGGNITRYDAQGNPIR